jgi:predicted Zn-dependent protease
MKKLAAIVALFSVLLLFNACKDDEGGGGFNLFSVQDDIELGQQLRDEILANPAEYPILDQTQYASAYSYMQDIVDDILASGEVRYADEFAWEVYIIDDSETLNAFAAPGGYIFIYTGILKFLDQKDDFVGVMGHEMAHADLRHSTTQLTEIYGVSTLLSLFLGEDQELLQNILNSLLSLRFSRGDESESDAASVRYLCETEYAANGAASFFEKLVAQGAAGGVPEFLSTHPSPDNRVEAINMEASDRNCDVTFDSDQQEWMDFLNSLP